MLLYVSLSLSIYIYIHTRIHILSVCIRSLRTSTYVLDVLCLIIVIVMYVYIMYVCVMFSLFVCGQDRRGKEEGGEVRIDRKTIIMNIVYVLLLTSTVRSSLTHN